MVNNRNEHTRKTSAKQGPDAVTLKLMKIGATTPYDFTGSKLTAYGGLLPVATMLEKLQFQQLIEEHVTIKRLTTSMPGFRFVLGMVLALYVGFSRLTGVEGVSAGPCCGSCPQPNVSNGVSPCAATSTERVLRSARQAQSGEPGR